MKIIDGKPEFKGAMVCISITGYSVCNILLWMNFLVL